MIVQARIAAGIAAAAATGALLTACSTPAPPPAATSTGSAPTTTTAAAAATTTANQASTHALQFPNKTVTVTLTGYDPSLHMVQFQLAVFVAGGPDDGHYSADPKDGSTHRLALAPYATMTSFSPDCTGASGANSDTPQGATCTTTQFASALSDGSGAGPAKLHVNAQDQIDTAQGLYHP
ncbi:MAG TPA: hypothetical protein VJ914_16770 [Pseudonocardiaceae bacterium]|nr:hypothetical protein [Pseudonocardiaceae bacterium]